MTKFNDIQALNNSHLQYVWEEDILDEYKDALAIELKGGKQLDGFTQFKEFYSNRVYNDYDGDGLRVNFLIIFHEIDSLFILRQIKNMKQTIEELVNPETWLSKSATTSNSKGKNISNSASDHQGNDVGSNFSRDKNINTNQTRSGQSVDGSAMLQEQGVDLLDTSERNINPHSYQQSNILVGVDNKTDTLGISTSKGSQSSLSVGLHSTTSGGMSISTNRSEAILTSLNIKLGSLRRRFFIKFNVLFVK